MDVGSKTQTRDISELQRGTVHVLWEGGDSTLSFTAAVGYPRALRVDVAGTLLLKDIQASPVQVTYNVIQGEIIPFSVSEIATTSTASVQVWW